MTNVNSPFGFKQVDAIGGSSPNYGLTWGLMAYNASACYMNDPLKLVSGKLAVATVTGNTGAAVAGIAAVFKWVSIAQNRTVIQSFYPGSDSQGNADVAVGYINLPNALFDVQSNGAAFAQTDVGRFVNFASGSGNTYTGQSGFTADYSTLNDSQGVLPFVIQSIEPAPGVSNYDPTLSYNIVRVGFATQTKI